MSDIEWTGQTWNAIVGCSKKSAGCKFCYAMGDSPHRFASKYDRPEAIIIGSNPKHPGLTYLPTIDGKSLGKGAQWTGEIRCLPWALDKPLGRQKPTTYFVNSLSDLFHEKLVGCEEGRRFIAAMFGVMGLCRQHTFQILTKRDPRPWFEWLNSVTHDDPSSLFKYLDDLAWEHPDLVIPQLQGLGDRRVEWPLPNVWIGTSVEDQAAADDRIPALLDVPAAVRFLSCEPLLGEIRFDPIPANMPTLGGRAPQWDWACPLTGRGWDPQSGEYSDEPVFASISWAICGGESGPKARECEIGWLRSIVEQCKAAWTACFVKQIGSKPLARDEFDLGPEAHAAWDAEHAGEPFPREGWIPKLRSSKGGDMDEWPEDLRVREMPDV